MAVSEFQSLLFAAQKEKYKRSLYAFFIKSFSILEPSTKFDDNWHIKYLCDILQEEAYRVKNNIPREKNFIINIPFRSSKSLIFSVIFPVWVWTFFPEAKILTLSYAESLAIKQSYLSKILITSPWYKEYFSEIKLMTDDSGKGHYRNVFGGFRSALGVVGAVTGDGGDFLIIDDPNKPNDSKKQLQNTNTTYDEVIFNRLNNPEVGGRFIIQQRLNQNDLSGHVTSKDEHEYETICIPAELGTNLEPTDLVEHYEDNLFWNKRFSRRILRQYKIALGLRGYNSQLNQKTSSEGGNILKEQWFKIVDGSDNKYSTIRWEMFIDPAYTSKQTNDPTGILICAKFGNDLIIKKALSVRLEFPDLINKIISLGKEYNINRIYIEPKASGKSVVQQLRKQTQLRVVELKVTSDDKETRCNGISPTVEGERVHLFDGSYVNNFIDEVCQFPLGTHDDMLDCLMYAVDKILINKKELNYHF